MFFLTLAYFVCEILFPVQLRCVCLYENGGGGEINGDSAENI